MEGYAGVNSKSSIFTYFGILSCSQLDIATSLSEIKSIPCFVWHKLQNRT